MSSFLQKYFAVKKRNTRVALYKMKRSRTYYLFLLPYAILFTAFTVLPVGMSIFFSFTYYNILEPAQFNGVQNYVSLLLADDVFLISVKNTFMMAAITGPLGYLSAFLFAWFINELPRYLRAFMVLVFYAPTISGQAYMIWSFLFSGDSYGQINATLLNMGIINEPKLWLTDVKLILPVLLIIIWWMSLGNGFLSFVAGLQGIDSAQFEAGYVDGIKNRWQELWFITLPNMKPMLLFGAVMAITQSFGVADVSMNLAGFPSTDYAGSTVVTHLIDYGLVRFEMGYASAIATVLFFAMILCNKAVHAMLRKVGT